MYLESINAQRGAGLPVALFVITVLALIVVGMGQLQQSTAGAVSLQIQSQRAFYAAESGAQVGVYKVFNGSNCAAYAETLNFGSGALSACSAAVNCSAQSNGSEELLTITSSGQCGSGPDLARRQIEVRVR